MRKTRRNLVILLSLCVFIMVGLSLFTSNKHKPSSSDSDIQQEDSQVLHHPRKIMRVLMKHYEAMKKEIKAMNKTLMKMENEISNSKSNAQTLVIKSPASVGNPRKLKYELNEIQHSTDDPAYNIHAFYYPWYGNPKLDDDYYHWNHQYIQHWKKEEASKWPSGRHKPPEDIGANFYPALGAYSSSDEEVVDVHMQMMKYAKIGVVVVSWYPPGDADTEGKQPDALMPLILNTAKKYGLKVAIHVEPYKGRNHITWRENLKYLTSAYGKHPAFYRTNYAGKTNLPLYYIYDSYTVKSHLWAEVFTEKGNISVRNTELDGIFIGLLVEQKHERELKQAGFDGIYTYFVTNGFTYGSSWVNWKSIAKFCSLQNLMFIPSVGPGYIDTEVRPWNAANKRKRLDGKYYNESFSNALKVSPSVISITSFNEWHEGTQIEPAVEKITSDRKYLSYGSKGPNFYLNLTRQFVSKFYTNTGT